MTEDLDQWSTVRPLLHGFPGWVGDPDRSRLAAYTTYEEMYWNVPNAYKLVQRGSDQNPIYVPAAKVIIESLNRYLANELRILVDPELGTSSDQSNAMLAITSLFRRERFYSLFEAAKRFGVMRGDWLFYLHADPELPEGSRISIAAIDPASYFPIWAEDDMDAKIGCHIVENVIIDGKPFIDRATYRKETEKRGPSPITYERALYKVDGWGGPGVDEGPTQKVITPPYRLPDPIDALPIYHIRNFQQPGADWGSSELRGMEGLLASINQSISDEELTLVMDGLGCYATDAGSPVDEQGNPTEWKLGPARVVEVPTGTTFSRVSGVTSVAPMQDHLKYLHEQLDLGSGTVSPAKGKVDVSVAESGIALTIEMGPLLSRVAEKEHEITDVLTNMLFDLRNWFTAYEGQSFGDAQWLPLYGDKIPPNRKAKFDEVMAMAGVPGLVSMAWVRKQLTEIGFEFDDDTTMLDEILTEQQAINTVALDPFASRVDSELGQFDTNGQGIDAEIGA